MKKSHWIVLAIVLAILLGIAIGVYFSEETQETNDKAKSNKTKLSEINKKIKELEERIQHEVMALRLTSDMERGLDERVDRICFAVGVAALGCLVFIAWLFNYFGFEWINAILSTAGLASILFPFISILL